MVRIKMRIGFIIVIFTTFLACKNKSEREIVGFYRIQKYIKSNSANKIDTPTLRLRSDKTFVLTFKQKEIAGKWEAGDYGDWISADFYYEGHHAQGVLGGQNLEVLTIVSPLNLNIDADTCLFVRIKND